MSACAARSFRCRKPRRRRISKRHGCQSEIFRGVDCQLLLRPRLQDRHSPADRRFSAVFPEFQLCEKESGLCCRSRRAQRRNRSSTPVRTAASPTTQADRAVEHRNDRRSEPSVCLRDVCCAPKQPDDPRLEPLLIPIRLLPISWTTIVRNL